MAKKDFIAPLAKTVASMAVVVSMVIVVFSLILNVYYEPAKVAERNFEKMARDYYENYLYPKIADSGDNLEETFKKYEDVGMAPVLLRQLLNYDGGKYAEAEKYFDTQKYKCDENETMAMFKPVAPYNAKNYEMTVEMSCNYR